MSNKLCFYKSGHFTKHEVCSLWFNINISYNCWKDSFVIASVGFNIDLITTQHAPKCVENCFDSNISIIVSNFYQLFYNLGYNSENIVFFSFLTAH